MKCRHCQSSDSLDLKEPSEGLLAPPTALSSSSVFTDGRIEARRSAAIFLTIISLLGLDRRKHPINILLLTQTLRHSIFNCLVVRQNVFDLEQTAQHSISFRIA
jgi:hypothetical protein